MKVAFLQINSSFAGQNYLPYSAALLESYFVHTSTAASSFDFLPIVYKRESINAILREIEDADILGLSLYAWNVKLSLAVAKALKELKPNCFIFAGGPSVPDNAEEFLRRNRYIDLAIHNEGEIAVTKLLESLLDKENVRAVPSTSFLVGGTINKNPNVERIKDLSTIASPFLSGVLERTMRHNSNESWIGLWETNRGCPFTCTYCDWGSATGSKQIGMFDLPRLEEEIEWFSRNKIEYIFCCDANFGMFPRDPIIAEMVGSVKMRTGYPHALSVQNTKNSTERSYKTQKILCDYGLNKGVTLSMQSLNEKALQNIKRSNIKLSSYFELQRRFISDKVPTYSDLILALPGETKDSYIKGLCRLVESGQHTRIQFNNLSILPNAEMAAPEYRERYGLRTVTTKIVNMHGVMNDEDEFIQEEQELVVETESLPAEDWRRIRAASWMVGLLYFDKVCQIPIAVVNGGMGLPFEKILCGFETLNGNEFPVLKGIYDRMLHEAQAIQNGAAEYIYSKQWLAVYWPVDELIFIELCEQGGLEELYMELTIYLATLVEKDLPDIAEFYGGEVVKEIISEASSLNNWMINRYRQKDVRTDFVCQWNIYDVYSSRIEGRFANIRKGQNIVALAGDDMGRFKTLDDWLKEIVWYGNKRGNYLRAVIQI